MAFDIFFAFLTTAGVLLAKIISKVLLWQEFLKQKIRLLKQKYRLIAIVALLKDQVLMFLLV